MPFLEWCPHFRVALREDAIRRYSCSSARCLLKFDCARDRGSIESATVAYFLKF